VRHRPYQTRGPPGPNLNQRPQAAATPGRARVPRAIPTSPGSPQGTNDSGTGQPRKRTVRHRPYRNQRASLEPYRPQRGEQKITPHRLFEKRTSRATNPWTAIVSANPSSSSHEQSAQCPHQNQRHHDRLAATGDPNDPRPSGTTARPELPPMRSRTGCLVVRPDAPHRRHRSRLLRLNPHCPSSNRNRTFQPHPRKT
jgi:hypothetical protein